MPEPLTALASGWMRIKQCAKACDLKASALALSGFD
jgi:hypothetical protein